jgi:hypothetical protein
MLSFYTWIMVVLMNINDIHALSFMLYIFGCLIQDHNI